MKPSSMDRSTSSPTIWSGEPRRRENANFSCALLLTTDAGRRTGLPAGASPTQIVALFVNKKMRQSTISSQHVCLPASFGMICSLVLVCKPLYLKRTMWASIHGGSRLVIDYILPCNEVSTPWSC
jgi:hypothetical protein